MIRIDQSIQRFLKPWIILLTCILIVGCYIYFDKQIAAALYRANLAQHIPILRAITFLGSSALYLVTLFILASIFRGISWAKDAHLQRTQLRSRYYWIFPNFNSVPEARVWFLITALTFTDLVCGVLKCLLGRARPMLWINQQQFGFYWFKIKPDYWSFPSGHTTTIMSLAIGLSVLFPRFSKVFLFSAVCIVVSRVLLVQHYVSDVLATTLLVLAEMGFLVGFLRDKQWLAEAWPMQLAIWPAKGGKTK